ncbi:MAG: hypothetical protein ACD_2C00038G0008 [uncultured bacterium (gcode 4)]|uniref:Uncharacterized protein n=1 Tax=uncultured bacterium (gcode 4) TaxID=1234023 RepID=K2FG78_9BACT|nr:MAG: hypothetical protein ACD_2C00038G0008 [uncultured bacterium (gcode 4)]
MKTGFKNNKWWFTMVELLVAILIFTLWWLSAYLLVYSAMSSSVKAKNEMIAWNLAREKIELVKNIRDTNWVRSLDWNRLDNWVVENPWSVPYLTWGYYKIENSFQLDDASRPSIKIIKMSPSFTETKNNILNPATIQDRTMLCLDDKWRYNYTCSPWEKPTKFYALLKVSPLVSTVAVDNAFRLDAIIYNYDRSFNKYVVSTIITDWKR